MLEGFKLTLMGMVTVFFFLSVLVMAIHIIGAICKTENKATKLQTSRPTTGHPSKQVVAAIMTAVNTYEKEMKV